jgi:dolichol-phosphate mannosyltransferase
MKTIILRAARRVRLEQFARFCVVGTSGLMVDMAALHCLVRWLGWDVSLSKLCSAETAMLSNFFLNEVWTFRGLARAGAGGRGLILRLLKFQAICGAGIGLAVLLLNLFYRRLGINLYAANLLAILLVTLWNFWMNAVFNWGPPGAKGSSCAHHAEAAGAPVAK